jgi:hypothetical protein
LSDYATCTKANYFFLTRRHLIGRISHISMRIQTPMRKRSTLTKFALIAGAFIAALALSSVVPRTAYAQQIFGLPHFPKFPPPGHHHQAPELDATSAAQGLVLIFGALVVVRRYRHKA